MDQTPNPPGAGDAGFAILFAFQRFQAGAPDLDRWQEGKGDAKTI